LQRSLSAIKPEVLLLLQAASSCHPIGWHDDLISGYLYNSIRDSDWILVMNNGDIVEQGKHDKLLAKKGFYTELLSSQFEAKEI